MRGVWWLPVVVGCGRLGFDAQQGADADPAGIVVLADFGDALPFNPNDFVDGGMVVDNAPNAVAALYPPFSDGFVVAAGRALIELRLDGTAIVHDYRPAVPDAGGPDNIAWATVGPLDRLWLAGGSWSDGDGLFYVDSSWALARESTLNNVASVAFDPTGAFDALGAPALYFNAGNLGVERRDSATTTTTIWSTGDNAGALAINASAVYAVDAVTGGPDRLWRIDATTHVATQIDSTSAIALVEGSADEGALPGIREHRDLVVYQPNGAWRVIASAPDDGTYWTAVCAPRAPHPLAGRLIVVELNPTIGRMRLLLLPP